MDNWNDYTLSTDEYTSSEPDPIPRDMHDMTATYDFTNMVEQAKSESDIRNAETADFTEAMQNAEPVVGQTTAEPAVGVSGAAAETTVEAAAEPTSFVGHEQDGLYGFTMRDPEPAVEPVQAADDIQTPESVHISESAPAAEPSPSEAYTTHDYTNTEFEPNGYTDSPATGYTQAGTGAAAAAAGAAAGSAYTGGTHSYSSGYGSSSYGSTYHSSASSYGGSGGYGGSGSGGNYGGGGHGGHGNGASSGYYEVPRRSKKKEKKPMQITKAGFVLTLIICMLLTSALTVAGLAYYGNNFAPGTNNATDYTLTSSDSDDSLSFNSVINKVQDSVVSITTESTAYDMWMQNYVTQGAGSGVIVQSNGYIVTCNHVIEGASKITVTLNNNKEYNATLIGADPKNDVAVLKIKATGLTAANYGDSSKLVPGDNVIAIGNPLGELSNTATTGIISALDRELTIDGKTMNLMQTDASINPGNSGGALFDTSGNLIGIVVAKSLGSDVEGLGFAIPINRVAELAKDMIENKDSFKQETPKDNYGTGDAAIGVTVGEVPDDQAARYGLPRGGIVIQSVTSRNAQQAGIQPGDMIISFEGKDVKSVDELHSALKEHKPGDKVSVGLFRNGQEVSVDVTLTQAGE